MHRPYVNAHSQAPAAEVLQPIDYSRPLAAAAHGLRRRSAASLPPSFPHPSPNHLTLAVPRCAYISAPTPLTCHMSLCHTLAHPSAAPGQPAMPPPSSQSVQHIWAGCTADTTPGGDTHAGRVWCDTVSQSAHESASTQLCSTTSRTRLLYSRLRVAAIHGSSGSLVVECVCSCVCVCVCSCACGAPSVVHSVRHALLT